MILTRRHLLAASAVLPHISDVPSVIYGKVTFDPVSRRAQAASYKFLTVKDNAFTIWDGVKPALPAL